MNHRALRGGNLNNLIDTPETAEFIRIRAAAWRLGNMDLVTQAEIALSTYCTETPDEGTNR